MKKNSLILGKSMFQTGVGLFIFALILSVLWIIVSLLKLFFKITLFISDTNLSLVLTILATIGTAMYIYNSDRFEKEKDETKKQLDLLKVLYEEFTFLEKNLESYKEVFSKPNRYPLYELWDIDTSVYFNGLGYKINNQETIGLKKNLMVIKDKILVIDNMKNEAKRLEEADVNSIAKKIDATKIIRDQIIKIIDEEILLIVKKSKEFLDNPSFK